MSSPEIIEPEKEFHNDKELYNDVQHHEGEAERHGSHVYDLDEKAKVADYKADAIEAENAEHDMTVLGAVRAYPMASFWAFVMSFTIVSSEFSLLNSTLCLCQRTRS